MCLVRRTPLFRWLQTVGCQVSLSWPSHTLSLIPVFSTSFQSFFHIDAFLDSAACMFACRSGYFLPSGTNPPSLKVVLVMSDIMLFTSSDVRLRGWLWCKTSVFICCGQIFPVGLRIGKCFQSSCCINWATFIKFSLNELMFPPKLDHYTLWLFQVLIFFCKSSCAHHLSEFGGRKTNVTNKWHKASFDQHCRPIVFASKAQFPESEVIR